MLIKKILFLLALFSAVTATALCQQATVLPPAAEQIEQANTYYDNKEYSKAISIYRKVAAANQDNTIGALAHYKCAKALQEMNKYDDAISECTESIAINPFMNDGIAYLLRAALYEKIGKYENAVSEYTKALLIDPDNEAAWANRRAILFQWYVIATNQGMAALSSGLSAYYKGDAGAAVKNIDKAFSLFNNARDFYTDDKTAFSMINFIKGFKYRMAARKMLDAIKDINSASAEQLVNVYYCLAMTDAYYKKALSYLTDEGFINPMKEQKDMNDQDLGLVSTRIIGLEPKAERYIKITDLEASAIVNFDVAGDLLASGDADGLKQVLDENNSIAYSLKKLGSPVPEAVNTPRENLIVPMDRGPREIELRSETADGIVYLCSAYAKLSKLFSYNITDTEWVKANKASLTSEINSCSGDLNNAKSLLKDAAFADHCTRLQRNLATLQKVAEKAGR